MLILAPFCASAQATANGNATPAAAAKVVLLVPSRGTRFADAGDAIRRGFMAARRVAGDTSRVDVVATDETAAQHGTALARARERGAEVVVGPLTRDAVNAVVDAVRDPVELVTLNYPDRDALPPTLLAFGLSIDQEARQVARAALGVAADGAATRPPPPSRLLIVGGPAPLERRATEAFRRALVELGQTPAVVEPKFDAAGLSDLAAQYRDQAFDVVFLALNAREAALVRARLNRAVSWWATSQVNPGNVVAQAVAGELSGIHFADMPWFLQPDQRAVAMYPRPSTDDGAALPVEMERLYALGIDAYRVARIWMTGSTQFELQGVTGELRIDRARSARVERAPVFAVFRGGRIQLEGVGP